MQKKIALSALLNMPLIHGSCAFVKPSTNIMLLTSVIFGFVVCKEGQKKNRIWIVSLEIVWFYRDFWADKRGVLSRGSVGSPSAQKCVLYK